MSGKPVCGRAMTPLLKGVTLPATLAVDGLSFAFEIDFVSGIAPSTSFAIPVAAISAVLTVVADLFANNPRVFPPYQILPRQGSAPAKK